MAVPCLITDGVEPAKVPRTFNWLVLKIVVEELPFAVSPPKMVLVWPPWTPRTVLPDPIVTAPIAVLATDAAMMPLEVTLTWFCTKALVSPWL